MTRTKPRRRPSAQTVSETPNAAPFPYRDYDTARHLLSTAIQRGTFYGLVTGPTGTGKTSLKDDIGADLDAHRHQLLYVSVSANATSIGLARFLAKTFRVTPRRSFLETVADLVAALKSHPTAIVVWLDEADQLPHDTLAELRGLVESDGQGRPLFSLVLSGLPELRSILDAPALFPLKRRLDLRCSLAGLRRDELDPFLAHRFGAAAACIEAPTDELFERTQASPALLHKVVTHALDLAGDAGVNDELIRVALESFGL